MYRLIKACVSAVKFSWSYFVPSCSNIKKPLALGASLVLPFLDILVSQTMIADQDNESKSSSAKDKFIESLPLILLSVIYCTGNVLNQYLTASMAQSIKKGNIQKLLDNDTKFLTNIGGSYTESLQEVTVGPTVENASAELITVSIGTMVNIISISSAFVRINVVCKSSDVVLYALGLSLATSLSTYVCGRSITNYNDNQRALYTNLVSKTSFIENNKDSIILSGAADFERESMLQALEISTKKMPTFLLSSFVNLFVGCMVGQIFIICLPNKFTENLGVTNVTYLNLAVSMLLTDIGSLTSKYSVESVSFEHNIKKLQDFNAFYEKLSRVYKDNNKVIQKFNQPVFSLENFSFWINDTAILKEVNITLGPNKIYRLSGDSGIGKTTFLKAITKCWAFTAGTVSYPSDQDDICFIPQEICMPPKLSILEIIAYPLKICDLIKAKYTSHNASDYYRNSCSSNKESQYDLKANITDNTLETPLRRDEYILDIEEAQSDRNSFIDKVKSLMQKVGLLKTGVIGEFGKIGEDELEVENLDWGSRLSGGEQRKLVIIGALLKKPSVLIMDEATVGIDRNNKQKIYHIIRDTIIKENSMKGGKWMVIFTDHNSIEDFSDDILKIQQHTLELVGGNFDIDCKE